MTKQVIPIPALKDNYIWLLTLPNHQAVIVDPGDAKPVLQVLKQNNLNLSAILITHHHWDHTNGVENLLQHFSVPVFGSMQDKVTGINQFVKQGDEIELTDQKLIFKVLEIPGHTLGHIAYFGNGMVFTGDTLFTGGCGRLFEGSAEQMVQSLHKLASLPAETKVYCGHEYTENNLRFALEVEPKNPDLLQRIKRTKELRSKNLPTVPATIAEEKQTNPFLRCEIPEVIKAAEEYLGHKTKNPVEVFAGLRFWKNDFK